MDGLVIGGRRSTSHVGVLEMSMSEDLRYHLAH
jgi:hypothetical protein